VIWPQTVSEGKNMRYKIIANETFMNDLHDCPSIKYSQREELINKLKEIVPQSKSKIEEKLKEIQLPQGFIQAYLTGYAIFVKSDSPRINSHYIGRITRNGSRNCSKKKTK